MVPSVYLLASSLVGSTYWCYPRVLHRGPSTTEALHQLGVVAGYMAGAQDTLKAGVTRFPTISASTVMLCPQQLVFLLFLCLKQSLLLDLEQDGDIYHYNALAVLISHNNVEAQPALTARDGVVDRHGPY